MKIHVRRRRRKRLIEGNAKSRLLKSNPDKDFDFDIVYFSDAPPILSFCLEVQSSNIVGSDRKSSAGYGPQNSPTSPLPQHTLYVHILTMTGARLFRAERHRRNSIIAGG